MVLTRELTTLGQPQLVRVVLPRLNHKLDHRNLAPAAELVGLQGDLHPIGVEPGGQVELEVGREDHSGGWGSREGYEAGCGVDRPAGGRLDAVPRDPDGAGDGLGDGAALDLAAARVALEQLEGGGRAVTSAERLARCLIVGPVSPRSDRLLERLPRRPYVPHRGSSARCRTQYQGRECGDRFRMLVATLHSAGATRCRSPCIRSNPRRLAFKAPFVRRPSRVRDTFGGGQLVPVGGSAQRNARHRSRQASCRAGP